MARINKAKNFAGKSYVVSNEVEALINSLAFDAKNSTLGFSAGQFGDDTTAAKSVSFADWINAAKEAAAQNAVTTVVGTATDAATADTVYGAKAFATAEADQALVDAKTYADGISAAAISVVDGNGISIVKNGTVNTINVKTDLIQLVAGANSENEFASVYDLKIADATAEGGYKSVGTINIPKDQFLKGAEYADGKITLTFAVDGKGDVATEIDVADLIDTYTAAQGATQIQLAVDNNVFSASVVADSITETELNASVNASLDLADSALQKADIASGSANGTIAVEGANVAVTGLKSAAFVETTAFDAAGTAQGLIDALDSTQTADEGKYISGITQVDGVITEITQTALPAAATLVTGDTNGTVKFNDTDVAVKGLGSAAYKNEDAFDAAGAAAAVLGSDADAAGADTVYGANKAAAAAAAAAGVADGKAVAAQNAAAAAQAAADAADGKADAAQAAADAAQAAADAAQADANKIATAVNTKAVQFLSSDVALNATTTSGTVNGRVIAVYDANGGQVYPEITFANNVSTIKAEGLSAEETFTVIYATTITIA